MKEHVYDTKIEIYYCDLCYDDSYASMAGVNRVASVARCRMCEKDLCKDHTFELLGFHFCRHCYENPQIISARDLIDQAIKELESACRNS